MNLYSRLHSILRLAPVGNRERIQRSLAAFVVGLAVLGGTPSAGTPAEQSAAVFEMVRHGKDTGNLITMIPTYKGKSVTIYNALQTGDSLADNRLTVCVPYPGNRRVWIAEGKSVRHVLSQNQREELLSQIRGNGGSFSVERFEALWVLDVNFDGRQDFILGESFAYSLLGKIYQMKREAKTDGYILIFPPRNNRCQLRSLGTYPLSTDGEHYYISNQCNLTELTSPSRKE